MQNRPFIWNQNLPLFNISKPWTQDYAKASDLVQELYNPETKNRSELIRDHLKENPEKIAHEIQKILERDLKKVKEKIAFIIDEYKQFKSQSTKSSDKITDAEVIRILNVNIGKKLNPGPYAGYNDLTLYEFADKYEKYRSKKKTIKKVENEILKEFGNLKIESNVSVKISI